MINVIVNKSLITIYFVSYYFGMVFGSRGRIHIFVTLWPRSLVIQVLLNLFCLIFSNLQPFNKINLHCAFLIPYLCSVKS